MSKSNLSPEMRALLTQMDEQAGVYAGCGGGNASRLNSLRRRGFAYRSDVGGRWKITTAGRAAIQEI